MKRQLTNLDGNMTAYFYKELDVLKAQSYDPEQRELKSAALIPMSSTSGSGIKTITHRIYTAIGTAKVISNMADDIPLVDIYGEEKSIKVFHIASGFHFNVFEIKPRL